MRMFVTNCLFIGYIFDDCSQNFIEETLLYNNIEEIKSKDTLLEVGDWYIFQDDRMTFYEWSGKSAHDIDFTPTDTITVVFNHMNPHDVYSKSINICYGKGEVLVQKFDIDHIYGICELNMPIPMFPIWLEYYQVENCAEIRLYTSSKEDAMQMRLSL